ncbi:vacuolar (H+)-ATPase G subunit domain-containing protein, putative [Eimeria brunetti]|uniref:Vacuolar (H+)-ATPase G subunit domain-containing protein, putative n=1 Tax=Eimeria brunetti TaxID=51314 RepID=U6LTL0_9EIME|nr:vacuolar (H+)-ATPase G subunit domain-containing protein, putative [Eimeria brunetti]
MPFWRRRSRAKADQNANQDSTAAANNSNNNPPLSKDDRHMSSLVCEQNDQKEQKEEQLCDSSEPSKRVVMVPAAAHGASPATAVEARPSLFRRTISSFSSKVIPKMRSDSSKTSGQSGANGDGRMAKTTSGGRHSNEGPVSAETDHGGWRALHGFRQRFHTTHHATTGQGGSGQYGTMDHSLHLPLHLRHLHFPHILHHPAQQEGVSSGDPEAEAMQRLQHAAEQAKRIVERARGEREILMQRAREEAEEEMAALRVELEGEAVRDQQKGNNGEDAIREATAEEDGRMRHILEQSSEHVDDAVSLCVGHVLNVDISLSVERRGVLRNLKNNPPKFLRKSYAKSYPSERRLLAERLEKGKKNLSVSDFSWDVDTLEYPMIDNASPDQDDVYAAILGERTLKEEEEVQIDFDELEDPAPLGRFSSAMQSIQTTCGCLLG